MKKRFEGGRKKTSRDAGIRARTEAAAKGENSNKSKNGRKPTRKIFCLDRHKKK